MNWTDRATLDNVIDQLHAHPTVINGRHTTVTQLTLNLLYAPKDAILCQYLTYPTFVAHYISFVIARSQVPSNVTDCAFCT